MSFLVHIDKVCHDSFNYVIPSHVTADILVYTCLAVPLPRIPSILGLTDYFYGFLPFLLPYTDQKINHGFASDTPTI